MTLGNSIKEASGSLYQEFEGVYNFSGIINDMDYFIHSTGKYAIWHVIFESGHYVWAIGLKTYLGIDYSVIHAGSSLLQNKCPNNEGYVWNWNIWANSSWIATNDVYIKCENEDDFCTSENRCGKNQGDCDTHDECQDNLFCESNNCPDSGDENFCTTANPCAVNEGDCNTHDKCQDTLICLSDNCLDSLGFDPE